LKTIIWPNHATSNKKIKSLLYSLYILSGVTSERCPTPRLCAKAHSSRFSHQNRRSPVLDDFWKFVTKI